MASNKKMLNSKNFTTTKNYFFDFFDFFDFFSKIILNSLFLLKYLLNKTAIVIEIS